MRKGKVSINIELDSPTLIVNSVSPDKRKLIFETEDIDNTSDKENPEFIIIDESHRDLNNR
jgi:hypothetical protein